MSSSFDLPYRRMEWLNFGDTIDAGDRTIEIIDPPVYDSPVTQGLFDRATGAMWAVDAFAAVVPGDEPPTSPRIFRRRNGRVSCLALASPPIPGSKVFGRNGSQLACRQ